MIAAIHAEARRIGLDDEAYRALLERTTGRNSCGRMSERQLAAVLDAIKGGRRAPAAPDCDRDACRRLRTKIWACAYELSKDVFGRHSTPRARAYLGGLERRMGSSEKDDPKRLHSMVCALHREMRARGLDNDSRRLH